MRNYTLDEIGTIAATESNVATIIDVSTQTFRLLPCVNAIVAAANWVDRNNLRQNMERLRAAVEAIRPVAENVPHYKEPNGNGLPNSYVVPAPALHAARALAGQFLFTRKAKLEATERNIAILIDVCSGIGRIVESINSLVTYTLAPRAQEIGEHLELLRNALCAVEVARNRMPSESQVAQITLRKKKDIEIHLTRKQISEAHALAVKVSSASTVEEQTRLLRAAGMVRI